MLRTLRPISVLRSFKTQRSFIALPGTEVQSLTATRILPYKSTSIYSIIADVDSYSTFVPYCQASQVTKWSAPDHNGKRWPSEAELTVGWGGYEETFTSKLFCVPGSIVEALSGEARTTIPTSELKHYGAILETPWTGNGIFQSLSTRWMVKPFHNKPPSGWPQPDFSGHPDNDQTEVHLKLEFQFSNPIYAALSKAVAPKVAGLMIEAFEVRARNLLDEPGFGMAQKDLFDVAFTAGKKIGA